MIDKYLENNVQKKINLFSILNIKQIIDIHELKDDSNLSTFSINSLIEELKYDIQGLAEIVYTQSTIELVYFEGITSFDIFHAIYATSSTLKCIKFLITNDAHTPFTVFVDDNFLTTSNGYRIRQSSLNYLRSIGLDVKNNMVVGDEYRIRFLIGLLYYKYGVDCCNIDSESIDLARKFVLATNDKINYQFLESTTDEYGYFECLLTLLWKRKGYHLTFPKYSEMERLKTLFIYRDITHYLRTVVEPQLDFKLSQKDLDYVFLIYWCANNCVLTGKWSENDNHILNTIIFNDLKFQDLMNKFEHKFKIPLKNSSAFKSVLVVFYKKCILNLQCIIPDNHYYFETKKEIISSHIVSSISDILNDWVKDNHILYPISQEHTDYLSVQLSVILRQFMDPIKIVLISDIDAEIAILKLFFLRNYPFQRIQIIECPINNAHLDFLSSLDDSIVIVKKVFENVIESYDIKNTNVVLPISMELNTLDRKNISNAVIDCEKEVFRKNILKISTKKTVM